jgi:hypothetical protein
MFKLIDLLKEDQNEEYPPYMYSPVGFGCHVCSYLNYNKDENRWTCGNNHYQKHMGTHYLVDPKTKEPIEDPSKYCSNWFKPKMK